MLIAALPTSSPKTRKNPDALQWVTFTETGTNQYYGIGLHNEKETTSDARNNLGESPENNAEKNPPRNILRCSKCTSITFLK